MMTNKRTSLIRWIWLFAIATFFAALICQINATDYALYGQTTHASNIKARTSKHATKTVGESKYRTIKAETVEISCYTGVESHGQNGRNPWSVATYRYPQGTVLEIEGFGRKVVETVTAKEYSNRIDVWFGETQEDYERCLDFGTQWLEVKRVE